MSNDLRCVFELKLLCESDVPNFVAMVLECEFLLLSVNLTETGYNSAPAAVA